MASDVTKEKLQAITKNPNDLLICIDMDGVICHGDWWGPQDVDPEPDEKFIEFMWSLYKKGAHLIIYTARQPRYYARTLGWLMKYEVPFHGIAMFVKPGADIYIDDKAMHPEDIQQLKTK